MRLAERIQRVMEIDPSATAMDYQGERISWGTLSGLTERIEAVLADVGVEESVPVGLLLRNRPEMYAAVLAMIARGRCIVCVNPLQGEEKLSADLEALEVCALVACAEDWDSEAARRGAANAGSVAIALDRKADPQVRLVRGLEKIGTGPHRSPAPGVAVEMLTSGTTGPPKRIELKAKAFEHGILGASHYESGRAEDPKLQRSFALVSAPLVHVGGLFHSVKSAADGRPICMLERFDIRNWVDAVHRHKPKVTSIVPSAIKMLMDADVPTGALSSLRAVTSGTAPLSPDLQTAFEERFGIPVLVTYGATEFAGGVAGWTIRDHETFGSAKRGSVGRAHPNCDLRIVDSETAEVLAPNESGLLEVRTDQAASKGWIQTSDLARIDHDGFVWIEGRADGAINRGGFKVDPAAVVRVLEKHPSIREAAVVGLPDERLGEIPVAVYELVEDAEPAGEVEIRDFAKQHLPPYFVPARVVRVEAIPRTPSLKPSMPALRALFAEE